MSCNHNRDPHRPLSMVSNISRAQKPQSQRAYLHSADALQLANRPLDELGGRGSRHALQGDDGDVVGRAQLVRLYHWSQFHGWELTGLNA